ncbi:MAG TPA: membrane protein insertase YidC [Dongiaceae bacterium]|jgi:YidC/Oxa1 family membrane protein insertase|nr:membrane protein insertase YidC [Dongiaceae bacterium]
MEQRNIIIAVILCFVILFGWNYFLAPKTSQPPAQHTQSTVAPSEQSTPPAPAALSREEALAQSPRLPIDTPRLKGSVSLKGGKVDDLILRDYKATVAADSPPVALLSPAQGQDGYFADWGWLGENDKIALPGSETLWKSQDRALTFDHPVTLSWDNGQGLEFRRVISVDANYMFTVSDSVVNHAASAISLSPFGRIKRIGTPPVVGTYVLHEGPIGVLDGSLHEIKYKSLKGEDPQEYTSNGGWLGITDKYWLTALVVPQGENIHATFHHIAKDDSYQSDFVGAKTVLMPGAERTFNGKFFAGAKEVKLLDAYRDQLGIPLFDRAVDFGWYYFLTKPMFYLLDWLYSLFGNFGLSILALTIIVKAVMFPLANRSYRSMSRMKLLQPKMQEIKERVGDDRQKLNMEMMELYKREKINPAAGCLPLLVQIPVFYSLYKVFYVTIEMRHAPFFGWIKDLSAPDPTSILNVFGLAPWATPHLGPLHFLSIGAWPLLMGFTMWLQQKLNPTPPDPTQARLFQLMPIIFTFTLGQFASGLVIYWAWNNTLSILQQKFIMWRVERSKPRLA